MTIIRIWQVDADSTSAADAAGVSVKSARGDLMSIVLVPEEEVQVGRTRTPLHAVTCRCMPLHAVACGYLGRADGEGDGAQHHGEHCERGQGATRRRLPGGREAST